MIKKIDVNKDCELKESTRRVDQYRAETRRWHDAMKQNSKGVVYKKDNGEPVFSPYLKIERESANSLAKVENTIKREIRDAEDRLIKAGTLIGMSPSSRASLSINQKSTESQDKTKIFRMLKHG